MNLGSGLEESKFAGQLLLSLIYFFADHSYIYCKASHEDATRFLELLHKFEEASQQVNLAKSNVFFSANVAGPSQLDLCNVLQMAEASKHNFYLGLPNILGHSKSMILSFLKDRVWKRVQNWDGKLLSYAGKEVLIKMVAQSFPTYVMSVFLLPFDVSKDLERIMSKFWWYSTSSHASLRNNPCFVWKSVFESHELLKSRVLQAIGSSVKVDILHQPWLLGDVCPFVTSDAQCLVGHKEHHGFYSVCSAYKWIQAQKGNWIVVDSSEFWRNLWHLKVPPKALNLRLLAGVRSIVAIDFCSWFDQILQRCISPNRVSKASFPVFKAGDGAEFRVKPQENTIKTTVDVVISMIEQRLVMA
ncbi:hypothetical protein CsatB_029506 [Cannabis sativa]